MYLLGIDAPRGFTVMIRGETLTAAERRAREKSAKLARPVAILDDFHEPLRWVTAETLPVDHGATFKVYLAATAYRADDDAIVARGLDLEAALATALATYREHFGRRQVVVFLWDEPVVTFDPADFS